MNDYRLEMYMKNGERKTMFFEYQDDLFHWASWFSFNLPELKSYRAYKNGILIQYYPSEK